MAFVSPPHFCLALLLLPVSPAASCPFPVQAPVDMCGTPEYAAPEVRTGEPQTEKAGGLLDVRWTKRWSRLL